MKKQITSWWKQLEYWKRGALISLILGFLIPLTLLILSLLSEVFIGFFVVYSFPTYLLLALLQIFLQIQFQGHGPSLFTVLIFETILYLTAGILIGYAIGRVKARFRK